MTGTTADAAWLERRVWIDIRPAGAPAGTDPGRISDIRDNLSVVAQRGGSLWLASDETMSVERVTSADGIHYGRGTPFRLTGIFTLPEPDEEKGEIDIEGLDIDGDWLWVTGSHSHARRKPPADVSDPEKVLRRLSEVRTQPNRWLLGRAPLVPGAAGEPEGLAGSDGAGRQAACLPFKKSGNALTKALKDDTLLGRFLEVPAKENGFDVEGLAVRGDRVLLGLRGPVLRGWAVILDLQVAEAAPGELALQPAGGDGNNYHKHLLDLDGLGIRELCFQGDDLLILAGPTMDLDGPVVVYRWRGALHAERDAILPRDRLERVFAVPYGQGCDHAEGMAVVTPPDGPPGLLLVYDSPCPRRCSDGRGVAADLFALP